MSRRQRRIGLLGTCNAFYAQESTTWMTRNTAIAFHRIPARWFTCPLISTSLRMSSALWASARSLGSLMGYELSPLKQTKLSCGQRERWTTRSWTLYRPTSLDGWCLSASSSSSHSFTISHISKTIYMIMRTSQTFRSPEPSTGSWLREGWKSKGIVAKCDYR